MWGLKGWVKVHSHTKLRQDILSYKTWYVGERRERRRVLLGKQHGAKIVVSLQGLDDPTSAACYVGKSIYVRADELPELAAGEFYWTQLQGLEAVNEAGSRLGIVDRLFETGANDVMVIRQGETEYLVPCVPDVVRRVDLEQGRIELNWQVDV